MKAVHLKLLTCYHPPTPGPDADAAHQPLCVRRRARRHRQAAPARALPADARPAGPVAVGRLPRQAARAGAVRPGGGGQPPRPQLDQ